MKNSAVSLTGTPSVITTASGISASIASTTAALVNVAGTKITVTLAPVASTASPTELKTGTRRCIELDHLTALAGGHAADDLGAGLQHPLGVLATLGAGHALDDDLGIGIQKD